MAITKVVDNANPLFDSIITYTITVVNNGPDKSFNVTVGDLLPDGVKFISSDGQYDPVTGLVIGALAYLVSKFKKQWYESDLIVLETIAEAELETLNRK